MGSAQIQGELWNIAPRDWADIQEPFHQPLWKAMLDASKVGSDTRFMDAGCGGGGASILAASRGTQISGIDAAEGLINLARERVPDGDFRVGDLEAMPFEDSAFDVVFAANSIQYTQNRVAALKELRRVCADDGRMVIGLFSTADKVEFRAFFSAIRDLLPAPPLGDGPFGLSGEGTLEVLLEQANLTAIERNEVNCPFIYPDFETFWRGNAAAGPLQGVMRLVGEENVKRALQDAMKPFQQSDGSIAIKENKFFYVVATP